MPRNFNKYQYETSPRKLEPEYAPKKNNYKGKKSTAKKPETKEKKNNKKKLQQERKKHRQVITYVVLGFAVLFAISYRNAQIDESFEKVQDYKKELASIEKENSQLELAIESSLNLSTIEQQAKELLGMQKLTNQQIVYVNLEKDDHIEAAAESVNIEKETFMDKIINTVKSLFK
ncbi:MAG: hypothetical protein ACI4U9_04125 [Clostridia bacterium]